MNRVTAHAFGQFKLMSALPVECLPAANDDIEGIEVTFLEIEEIELESESVQAWRPS